MACAHYPEKYQELILAQNKIGWINLYQGKWSSEWSQLHTIYAANGQVHTTVTDGNIWVQKCGRHLIERWLVLWRLRNHERHGATQEERKAKLEATLLHQLEEYYNLRQTVVPFDRQLLFPYENAETHLQASKDLESLQEWILDHQPLAHASAQQALQNTIHGTQDIRPWLRHSSTQPPIEPPGNYLPPRST